LVGFEAASSDEEGGSNGGLDDDILAVWNPSVPSPMQACTTENITGTADQPPHIPVLYNFDPLSAFVASPSSTFNHTFDDSPPPEFLDYDWAYLPSKIPKHSRKTPSFDTNHQKPKMARDRLPVYSIDQVNAPRCNYLFVCERPKIHRFLPTMEALEPLETPFTLSVDIWRRRDRGMMLRNKLNICHHYEIRGETLDDFVRDAATRDIATNYYPADGVIKKVSKDGHHLFLCNGGDFKGILKKLDLCSIAKDLFKNSNDPKCVPKLNK
jgi:hypothetical protein